MEYHVHLNENHSLFVRLNQIKLFIQKSRIGLSLSPLSEGANLPSIQCRVDEEIRQNFWRKVEEFLEPNKGLYRLRDHGNRLRTTSCCEMGIPEFPHWAHCTLFQSVLTASSCVTTRGLIILILILGRGHLFGCLTVLAPISSLSLGFSGTKTQQPNQWKDNIEWKCRWNASVALRVHWSSVTCPVC